MRRLFSFVLYMVMLMGASTALAGERSLEQLLRVEVFNREFEGFDAYYVSIEADHPQSDGSREVLAVASGKFLDNTKRLKVLFLIVGEQIIGGQVLEGTGLPPCLSPAYRPSSSL